MQALRIMIVVLAAGGAAARGQAALPASLGQQPGMEREGRGIHAGTGGVMVPSAGQGAGGAKGAAPVRLTLLGALPEGSAREVARSVNLLRPDALFCAGDMVPGRAAGSERYTKEIKALREALDPLAMPWYPCVGAGEVAGDRQLEGLYQRYLGPLYYGVDVGTAHVVVLDSEEQGATLSEAQLAFLKTDLNRAFERGRIKQVVVVVHRALWQAGKEGNWQRAHELLVDFNRRPIVTVEGMGGGSADLQGPRVVGVFAGTSVSGQGEYALDPARDGIKYVVLGPAAGTAAGAKGPLGRVVAMVTLEQGDPGMTVGLLSLEGRAGTPAVAAEDAVTAEERALAEKVQAWGGDVVGIEGTLDRDGGALTVRAGNPLALPVELLVRVRGEARTRGLAAMVGENAWMDGWWETAGGRGWTLLAPGSKATWSMAVRRAGGMVNLQPPVVEMVVRWKDGRGRSWEAVLPRQVGMKVAATAPSGTHPAAK